MGVGGSAEEFGGCAAVVAEHVGPTVWLGGGNECRLGGVCAACGAKAGAGSAIRSRMSIWGRTVDTVFTACASSPVLTLIGLV